MEVYGQLHDQAITPWKDSSMHIKWEAVWTQSQSESCKEKGLGQHKESTNDLALSSPQPMHYTE
jgi:hypothetical protein